MARYIHILIFDKIDSPRYHMHLFSIDDDKKVVFISKLMFNLETRMRN
jgi:hypothetical protein